MDRFEINTDIIDQLKEAVGNKDEEFIRNLLDGLHAADIAEILDKLDIEDGLFVLDLLEDTLASNVLVELDEDKRKRYLEQLSSKEIAETIVENLESDDAADIVGELPEEKREEVISEIEDIDQASDIVDLLTYEDGTAGALMGKEMVVVRDNWTVTRAVREMRKQAENIKQVYTIYVVDKDNKLLGRLPLKKLLIADVNAKIKDIYIPNIEAVRTDTTQEEVAQIMDKYDLVALPVVNSLGQLVGRITIDDVVDMIREESEKDYQMASGISEVVEYQDSIWQLLRARLPWLIIGIGGSMLSAIVIGGYEEAIKILPSLAFFIPMITATGGNIGVQSSAIIVQGLANNSLDTGGIGKKLWKEFKQGIFSGLLISFLALSMSYIAFHDANLGITISISLFIIILWASLTGTFIPLVLNRMKIDPALATGPFITTMNDITGLFIYFHVSMFIYSGL